MNTYPIGSDLHDIAVRHRQAADLLPFDGLERNAWVLEKLKFVLLEYNAICILSFDVGAHTSGWWKNPDYEACFHLSLSFYDPETHEPAPRDGKATKTIVRGLLGSWARLAWCEPPTYEEGKARDVWHYRVFIDRATMLPILPRGEVYSKELTEAGWKSYSEVRAEIEKEAEAAMERAAENH